MMANAALQRARRVHFVGIGGAGMCGIAEVLLAAGHAVSGSDVAESATVRRLRALGAPVRRGHAAEAVADADALVVSSAIGDDNVEVASARARGIPVLRRAEMLAELMRFRYGIAIAGSHGKTTTAALVASIFDAAGLDPGFVIGATLAASGSNGRLGSGRHLIAEADESDASLLCLMPMLAVLTNVDRDHLETYDQDVDALGRTFADFAARLPFYGTLVVCADDPAAMAVAAHVARPRVTYGCCAAADVRATAVRGDAGFSTFEVSRPDAPPLLASVPLPGLHNVQNALAAIAVATDQGVPAPAIVAGLESFGGVERRFCIANCALGGKPFTLVDDYGHHPTEIAGMIEALRGLWPYRRLVMVFQPHRYTRTRDLLAEFAAVLSEVDALLLLEVYAASEPPIPGADGAALAAAVQRCGRLRPMLADTPEQALHLLPDWIAADDVLVVQGAGDVDRVATALREAA